MTHSQKIELWSAAVVAVVLAIASVLLVHWHRQSAVTLQGAVIVQDSDPRKELPIADVEVSVGAATERFALRGRSQQYVRLPVPQCGQRGGPWSADAQLQRLCVRRSGSAVRLAPALQTQYPETTWPHPE